MKVFRAFRKTPGVVALKNMAGLHKMTIILAHFSARRYLFPPSTIPLSCSPVFLKTVMSVLLETSAGDIVIDLLIEYAPKLCEK
jgi:hypothetical protein